jgi:hypothetical protein
MGFFAVSETVVIGKERLVIPTALLETTNLQISTGILIPEALNFRFIHDDAPANHPWRMRELSLAKDSTIDTL